MPTSPCCSTGFSSSAPTSQLRRSGTHRRQLRRWRNGSAAQRSRLRPPPSSGVSTAPIEWHSGRSHHGTSTSSTAWPWTHRTRTDGDTRVDHSHQRTSAPRCSADPCSASSQWCPRLGSLWDASRPTTPTSSVAIAQSLPLEGPDRARARERWLRAAASLSSTCSTTSRFTRCSSRCRSTTRRSLGHRRTASLSLRRRSPTSTSSPAGDGRSRSTRSPAPVGLDW